MRIVNNILYYVSVLPQLVQQYIVFNKMGLEAVDYGNINESSKFWKDKNKNIKKLPFWFTKNKEIRSTMFVDAGGAWLKKQIDFLRSNKSEVFLRDILSEVPVGLPNIITNRYKSSHNSIHHLYHLCYLEKKVSVQVDKFTHYIEYGAGYGNMARLLFKINPNAVCILLDLPTFTEIQYRYLITVFGKEKVHIVNQINGDELPGIYLVRNYQLNARKIHMPKLSNSLFLATWSLSESDKNSQKLVEDLNFFNSNFLLIAYQKKNEYFENSERYTSPIHGYSLIVNEETKYISNNYYSIYKKVGNGKE